MELVNFMYKYKEGKDFNPELFKQAIHKLVLILAPFTPHVCEEMWSGLGNETSVHLEAWPIVDEKVLVRDVVEIVVQINGKVKFKVDVENGLSKEELEKSLFEKEEVKNLIQGKDVIKVIAVPNKLLNIVVK